MSAELNLVVFLLLLTLILVMLLTAALNALTFPRLRRQAPQSTPIVSLLVPARDEAGRIGATVSHLLRQTYPDYELIVLDDHSCDGTAAEALRAAGEDPRFRLVPGEPLPAGWTGKNWACRQLANLARGDLLVFTDADVRWEPGALEAAVAAQQRHRAGLLAVWPRQVARTWSERMVVPLVNFVVLAYLPEIAVRMLPWRVFAAANGQALVFTRQAYARSGGHAAVRERVLEDVALARQVKASGGRLVMALAGELIVTRMYTGWAEVRDGFAKNILAGYGGSPVFLLLAALFHWAVFLFPWAWLAWAGLRGVGAPGVIMPLSLILAGLLARLLAAMLAGDRLQDAFFMPVSVVLMSLIAGRALRWHLSPSGPQWKGRGLRVE